MSEEIPESAGGETLAVERGFRLLDQALSEEGITLRDDQQPLAWLLDAAAVARRRGRRLRVVDSGQLDVFSLEWLAKAGADLYTADDIRADALALIRIRAAGRTCGARVVFFMHGPLTASPVEGALSKEAARELIRSGIDLHLSNRGQARDLTALFDLAASRRGGGAQVVYYHHGPLLRDHAELAGKGAWLHISNARSDLRMAELPLLRDICRAGRSAGSGLVVHVDAAIEPLLLAEIRKDGAYIVFNIPHGSRNIKPRLPRFAFYLDTTFLL